MAWGSNCSPVFETRVEQPMSQIRLSVIIVHYNSPELVAQCLYSIDKYIIDPTKEVIIVDNNSRQESLDALAGEYSYLKVIRLPENMGFGYANNVGVKNAKGDMVLLLNSDARFIDYSINDALDDFYKARARVMWGFKTLWPDGRFQNSFSREIAFFDFVASYTPLAHFAGRIKRIGYHKYYGEPLTEIAEVHVIYGVVMLLWREDYCALNGFDTRYFMYYEDIDFCDRFRNVLQGKIYYHPEVSLIHNVQGSAKGKNDIDQIYLKSKYVYGLKRFKVFRMLVFAVVDFTLMLFIMVYKHLSKAR